MSAKISNFFKNLKPYQEESEFIEKSSKISTLDKDFSTRKFIRKSQLEKTDNSNIEKLEETLIEISDSEISDLDVDYVTIRKASYVLENIRKVIPENKKLEMFKSYEIKGTKRNVLTPKNQNKQKKNKSKTENLNISFSTPKPKPSRKKNSANSPRTPKITDHFSINSSQSSSCSKNNQTMNTTIANDSSSDDGIQMFEEFIIEPEFVASNVSETKPNRKSINSGLMVVTNYNYQKPSTSSCISPKSSSSDLNTHKPKPKIGPKSVIEKFSSQEEDLKNGSSADTSLKSIENCSNFSNSSTPKMKPKIGPKSVMEKSKAKSRDSKKHEKNVSMELEKASSGSSNGKMSNSSTLKIKPKIGPKSVIERLVKNNDLYDEDLPLKSSKTDLSDKVSQILHNKVKKPIGPKSFMKKLAEKNGNVENSEEKNSLSGNSKRLNTSKPKIGPKSVMMKFAAESRKSSLEDSTLNDSEAKTSEVSKKSENLEKEKAEKSFNRSLNNSNRMSDIPKCRPKIGPKSVMKKFADKNKSLDESSLMNFDSTTSSSNLDTQKTSTPKIMSNVPFGPRFVKENFLAERMREKSTKFCSTNDDSKVEGENFNSSNSVNTERVSSSKTKKPKIGPKSVMEKLVKKDKKIKSFHENSKKKLNEDEKIELIKDSELDEVSESPVQKSDENSSASSSENSEQKALKIKRKSLKVSKRRLSSESSNSSSQQSKKVIKKRKLNGTKNTSSPASSSDPTTESDSSSPQNVSLKYEPSILINSSQVKKESDLDTSILNFCQVTKTFKTKKMRQSQLRIKIFGSKTSGRKSSLSPKDFENDLQIDDSIEVKEELSSTYSDNSTESVVNTSIRPEFVSKLADDLQKYTVYPKDLEIVECAVGLENIMERKGRKQLENVKLEKDKEALIVLSPKKIKISEEILVKVEDKKTNSDIKNESSTKSGNDEEKSTKISQKSHDSEVMEVDDEDNEVDLLNSQIQDDDSIQIDNYIDETSANTKNNSKPASLTIESVTSVNDSEVVSKFQKPDQIFTNSEAKSQNRGASKLNKRARSASVSENFSQKNSKSSSKTKNKFLNLSTSVIETGRNKKHKVGLKNMTKMNKSMDDKLKIIFHADSFLDDFKLFSEFTIEIERSSEEESQKVGEKSRKLSFDSEKIGEELLEKGENLSLNVRDSGESASMKVAEIQKSAKIPLISDFFSTIQKYTEEIINKSAETSLKNNDSEQNLVIDEDYSHDSQVKKIINPEDVETETPKIIERTSTHPVSIPDVDDSNSISSNLITINSKLLNFENSIIEPETSDPEFDFPIGNFKTNLETSKNVEMLNVTIVDKNFEEKESHMETEFIPELQEDIFKTFEETEEKMENL